MRSAVALACWADCTRRGSNAPGDGRLLDDAVRIARMQAVDERDDAARLVDDGAQILAGPLLARAGDEHRLFEAGVDQEVLQRRAGP